MTNDKIRALLVPVPEMSYRPNKLHGDELVAVGGRVYTELTGEWIDASEIDALLKQDSSIPLVMIEMDAFRPRFYRFSGSSAWKVIRKFYVTDDGYPPDGVQVPVSARIWQDSEKSKLLLFTYEH